MSCQDKFWLDDINQLFCSIDMIPSDGDSLEVILNKVSRFALVLSIIILPFSILLGVVTLVLSLVIVTSLYYSLKVTKAEEYTEFPTEFSPTSSRFCSCTPETPNDPDYTSPNQLLTLGSNPKTRIPPIIAPRSHDLDVWKVNGLVKHSGINDKTSFSLSSSGQTYQDDVLTQTIQPGVYQKSLVGEPINSMIGISYNQQFLPTLVERTPDEIKLTSYPPQTYPQVDLKACAQAYPQGYPTESNTYDPRFTGYGDSTRTYIDVVTGQPRFFYDDINSVRMPNYISRNQVDIYPWASAYGPDVPVDTSVTRSLANEAFHESALTFRTEMQERLMRKRNAEMWQRRVAPINTMSCRKTCG